MKAFSVPLPLSFQFLVHSFNKLQKLINVPAGIRKYWWGIFSKINKRTGTTIPYSRVLTSIQPARVIGKLKKTTSYSITIGEPFI